MRILITGSRAWSEPGPIIEALLAAADGIPTRAITVVHGGAPGADRLAGMAARKHLPGCTIEVHQANWRPAPGVYDRGAGFARNKKMVNLGADVCLAFIRDNSPGATHCAGWAERAGIEVRRFTDNVGA